jgi:hypothetical protein
MVCTSVTVVGRRHVPLSSPPVPLRQSVVVTVVKTSLSTLVLVENEVVSANDVIVSNSVSVGVGVQTASAMVGGGCDIESIREKSG